MKVDRWPPTYDAEQLALQIEKLARDKELYKRFYAGTADGGAFCQGDVLAFEAELPCLDEDGQAVTGGTFGHWLIIGNTCDFDRAYDDVPWSQIVPIATVPAEEIAAVARDGARTYATTRSFHLPPWPGSNGTHGLANFQTPVTVDKRALASKATVEARLSTIGWVLLHSCLVRFLARDDGRFDE